jgi:hypothetical protein
VDYLKIANWEKWQSYRKDRPPPHYIKIHRALMRNPEWVSLTDAQRGQMISIWLLSADHGGSIPADAELVARLCYMTTTPDLVIFMELGFIENSDALLKAMPIKNLSMKIEKDLALMEEINSLIAIWLEMPNLKTLKEGTEVYKKTRAICGKRLKEGRPVISLQKAIRRYDELVGTKTAPGWDKWGLKELFGRDSGDWIDTMLDPNYQGIQRGQKREIADTMGTSQDNIPMFTPEEQAAAKARNAKKLQELKEKDAEIQPIETPPITERNATPALDPAEEAS